MTPLAWLLFTLLCILTEGFFAMGEIAIISFNKVRLQYYVNKQKKRALWIYELLMHPARLFGTVLLGVNVALQVGSESSRQFYNSLGIDPNWAVLTQFTFVVIIAELAPLFAGRRFAEHAALIQVPIIIATSKILAPFVWLFSLCVRLVNKLFNVKQEELRGFLSREELQRVVEEHDEVAYTPHAQEFNLVVSNLFLLRSKIARQVMIPLSDLKMVPSNTTVEQFRSHLFEIKHFTIPIYHKLRTHIVGLVHVRDLCRAQDNQRVKEFSKSPWFITEEMPAIQILNQFRCNNQNAAIVLDAKGWACGLLTLDDILEEIFHEEAAAHALKTVIDRRFPGSMRLLEFNKEFSAHLSGAETLEELILKHLEHHPTEGDSVRLHQFELTVEECTIRGIKSISVRTLT